MPTSDIRWKQRFENYRKALGQLTRFVEKGELNELEEQGLIQSFEHTYERAWNTLKDVLEYQGENNLLGSRDVFRLAFSRGLIVNGDTWMDMIKDRGLTTHTYNESTAAAIAANIRSKYFPEFTRLRSRLETLPGDSQ